MIVCGGFFTLPSIESNNLKCCPALPEAWVRSPCIYIMVLFSLGNRDFGQEFFRLGLSLGFSKQEFLGQIGSFESRLRGAAPTPLARPAVSVPHVDVKADGG